MLLFEAAIESNSPLLFIAFCRYQQHDADQQRKTHKLYIKLWNSGQLQEIVVKPNKPEQDEQLFKL